MLHALFQGNPFSGSGDEDFKSLIINEGRAKSSVTNRLPKFYPRYILKCFTAFEWCVE